MAYTHSLVCQHCISLIAKNDYTSFLAANMMMAMDYIPRKMPKLIATNMAIQQPTRHGTPMDVLFFGKRLSGHCRHIWLSVGNAISIMWPNFLETGHPWLLAKCTGLVLLILGLVEPHPGSATWCCTLLGPPHRVTTLDQHS